jgi:hypothetical protein
MSGWQKLRSRTLWQHVSFRPLSLKGILRLCEVLNKHGFLEIVIPAQAGIQDSECLLDPSFRWGDKVPDFIHRVP